MTKQELKAQWRQHPVTRELIEFVGTSRETSGTNLLSAAVNPAAERSVGAYAGQMEALGWVLDYIVSDPKEEVSEEDE